MTVFKFLEVSSIVVAIPSFVIGIISLVLAGSTKKALKKQADAFNRKQAARELLPKIQKLSKKIAKNPNDSKQMLQELLAASSLLSEARFSIGSTQKPVSRLFDMLDEDYNAQARSENPVHSFLDYSDTLGQVITLLKKEVD